MFSHLLIIISLFYFYNIRAVFTEIETRDLDIEVQHRNIYVEGKILKAKYFEHDWDGENEPPSYLHLKR